MQKVKKIAILFSGNGSNMENLIKELHQKSFVLGGAGGSEARENQANKDDRRAGKNEIREIDEIRGKDAGDKTSGDSTPIGLEIKLEITACICNKKDAYGITRCQNLNIPCIMLPHEEFKTREAFDEALASKLVDLGVDLVLLAGFMRILTPDFTSRFKIINIHPSLLPKHKGAHAIEDTYFSHDAEGGVSVHWVNEELDGGEIILQDSIPKIQGESLEDFSARIHQLEYTLYPKAVIRALEQLEGRA